MIMLCLSVCFLAKNYLVWIAIILYSRNLIHYYLVEIFKNKYIQENTVKYVKDKIYFLKLNI